MRSDAFGGSLSSILIYKKLKKMSSTTTLVLGGIPKEAVEKIIITFSGFPIKSVQEKVLIQLKSLHHLLMIFVGEKEEVFTSFVW